MNTTAHPVAPEEVMAFLDGELSAADAQAASLHLDRCAECASLAEQFRRASQSLAQWRVPALPSSLEESVQGFAAKIRSGAKAGKAERLIRLSFWNWRLWAIGGCGAVAVILGLVIFIWAGIVRSEKADAPRPASAQMAGSETEMATRSADQPFSGKKPSTSARESQKVAILAVAPPPASIPGGIAGAVGGGNAPDAAAFAPMIARTVSLSIVVKDFSASRASFDSILARHHGYSAQLTVSTPENAPRVFQASLRIPAQELASALADIKALGRVENETQTGEEVTQQHADLVARLTNARETEDRFRAILQQRTGKIEDILQVEQEIARVRGEIEEMEAEQKALEHRVDFATVDLQLTEEYSARLNSPSASVANRIHNAFVAGLRNASATLLGIVLFLEEYGPVLLIWLAILGLPVILLLRRYRRIHSKA